VRSVRPHSRQASLGRSVRLFRLFLREQTEPATFYSALAEDSVRQLAGWVDLAGATVLDVGGGPGYFGRAFHQAGARYIGLELDVPSDMPVEIAAVRGSGEAIPIATASIDVAYCSNVVEHVRRAWRMADELARVTVPGGIVFISFTPWFSPWGGHETSPWHLLGGRFASRRFTRRTGRPPKNDYGETLFGHRVRDALRWARSRPDLEFVAILPRYHPRWAWWVVRVPIVREFAVWNIVLVLRKR
jgi:SAM-dependent methyltransferase